MGIVELWCGFQSHRAALDWQETKRLLNWTDFSQMSVFDTEPSSFVLVFMTVSVCCYQLVQDLNLLQLNMTWMNEDRQTFH